MPSLGHEAIAARATDILVGRSPRCCGAPARMLVLFAPGPPREEYFTELADIRSFGRTMTDEDWIAVWARHDQYQT
jgi:hypothetical protein